MLQGQTRDIEVFTADKGRPQVEEFILSVEEAWVAYGWNECHRINAAVLRTKGSAKFTIRNTPSLINADT